MREVKLSDGSKIEVRGLTRREKKEGKLYGFGPIAFEFKSSAQANRAWDHIVKCLALPDLPDESNDSDEALILKAVIDETYGVEEEEKNSSRSGDRGRTESA